MNQSTVTVLARKPIVRSMTQAMIDDALDDNVEGTRLISLYLPEPQAQVMIRAEGQQAVWIGSWSPMTKARAVECAREQAYKAGIAHERNLFYVIPDPAGKDTRYLECDVDASSPCLDVDILGTYQDRGDDCMVVLYHARTREYQTYRVRDGILEWWWKSQPHERDDALQMANRHRLEYALSFDALHFHDIVEASSDAA